MFHKLHLQLTALCTLVTGMIMTVLTIICLFISESGIHKQESSAFQANLNAIYQSLELPSPLSHSWIRQMEHDYQCSIRILDNGKPLFYQKLNTGSLPDELWMNAQKTAKTDYGIDVEKPATFGVLSRHAEFSMRDGQNRPYDVSAGLISHSGGYIGVIVLHSLRSTEKHIALQRLSFLCADLAALLLLTVFFWCFTSRMLHPLQENRKKQMQFIASASHELRSPLTVILSNVSAVKNGIMANDQKFLDIIDAEGNRMSHLVSDMLQLASADSHTWSICLEKTELDTLLLQMWEDFEPVALARHLRWDIVLPENPIPECFCDGERIRQLLSILIDNAFSYTPSGGAVRLTLQYHTPDSFSIAVSDNGPGIPDEEKESVFERFRRLDASRKEKSHFGLGLCIAQEIIQLHRGKILLTDTPGGGATFTVLLPIGKR